MYIRVEIYHGCDATPKIFGMSETEMKKLEQLLGPKNKQLFETIKKAILNATNVPGDSDKTLRVKTYDNNDGYAKSILEGFLNLGPEDIPTIKGMLNKLIPGVQPVSLNWTAGHTPDNPNGLIWSESFTPGIGWRVWVDKVEVQ